jgi:hypothetical protein
MGLILGSVLLIQLGSAGRPRIAGPQAEPTLRRRDPAGV